MRLSMEVQRAIRANIFQCTETVTYICHSILNRVFSSQISRFLCFDANVLISV